jgi:hypothetical protein
MAREKLNEYHLLDHDRDVHVTVDEGITVYADPSLVEVVMDNILSNAWKYTSKREVGRIHVFAQVTRQATWVHVSDNGAGFDMSRAAELFQPFKRLHTAAEFPGTGVGLSTVRRILSRHGGRIEFSSTPGMGSTFWFNFGDST